MNEKPCIIVQDSERKFEAQLSETSKASWHYVFESDEFGATERT